MSMTKEVGPHVLKKGILRTRRKPQITEWNGGHCKLEWMVSTQNYHKVGSTKTYETIDEEQEGNNECHYVLKVRITLFTMS